MSIELGNQLDETYDTVQLTEKVRRTAGEFGIEVRLERVANPRVESEEQFYRVQRNLLPSIGFRRTKDMDEVLREIFRLVLANMEGGEDEIVHGTDGEMVRSEACEVGLVPPSA